MDDRAGDGARTRNRPELVAPVAELVPHGLVQGAPDHRGWSAEAAEAASEAKLTLRGNCSGVIPLLIRSDSVPIPEN